MKRILLLGDSITEWSVDVAQSGWALHLLDAYRRRADIFVRGFSGYNTRWLLKFLREKPNEIIPGINDISSCSLDLVVIFLGANDAVIPTVYQHVPLDEYKQNLEDIVNLLRGCTKRFLLVTPPPYDGVKYMRCTGYESSHRSDERSKLYAQAVLDVVAKLKNPNVAALNINDGFRERFGDTNNTKNNDSKKKTGSKAHETGAASSWSDALSDGLHLGPLANKALAEMVLQTVKVKFPELDPERMEMLLPSHRDFMENPPAVAATANPAAASAGKKKAATKQEQQPAAKKSATTAAAKKAKKA